MASANYNLELNDGWHFHLGEFEAPKNMHINKFHETSAAGGAYLEYDLFKNPEDWKPVNVPHDWYTELPLDNTLDAAGGYIQRGTAWYYKTFKLPEDEIFSARLVFDGVLGKTTVFVNGIVAHRNFSGYNRFSCEIGDYLIPGEDNTIVLYVDARRWEGWWYEGAGLYRYSRIEFRTENAISKDECYITSKNNKGDWQVLADIKTSVPNSTVYATLQDENGGVVGTKKFLSGEQITIDVPTAKLWSPECPYLYTLKCELYVDDEIKDKAEFSVGLRTIEWIANEGMYLNGKPYRVKGICCHQDHAGVGAAVTKEIVEFKISTLKEFGINAYRCAHHCPSPDLLETCDRLGMLVMVENRNFAVSEDVYKQLDSLVLLSRNHPSVFLYCLFNEEPWQSTDRGRRISAKLRARIRLLDKTRAIVGAQNGGLLEKSNASDSLDVIGVNYFIKEYEESHKRNPDKVFIGTENCPTYATRGVYKTDKEKQVYGSYGDVWADTFSESLEETMENVENRSYVAGCFAWSGFDYRGEPTPFEWPSVLSHWGFCDDCGFPKDTAYFLKAWYSSELMVHLLPHWNWNKGDVVRVCAFTNGDSAELFLNGKSQGVVKAERKRCEWQVPYEEGTIKVIASRNGEEVSEEITTALSPQKLLLSDVSNSSDIHIINISAVDKNGVVVPDFCEEIEFVLPEGKLLGVGNGDPNDPHYFKATTLNMFNGHAQIVTAGGDGTLKVKCKSLPDAELKL